MVECAPSPMTSAKLHAIRSRLAFLTELQRDCRSELAVARGIGERRMRRRLLVTLSVARSRQATLYAQAIGLLSVQG